MPAPAAPLAPLEALDAFHHGAYLLAGVDAGSGANISWAAVTHETNPRVVPIRKKGNMPFTSVQAIDALEHTSAAVTGSAAFANLRQLQASAELKAAGQQWFKLLDFARH